MFDLDQFIADLRETLPERSRQAMRQVVARAVSDPAGIARCLGAPDKPAIQVLHHSAEFTVMNIAWAPQQVTLPHNHLLAAVIGMYSGREDNVFWRKLPNPEKYQIEPAGGAALGVGDVALLGRDIIHSVVNPLGRISAAIHVYDGDFFAAERSMWDPESLAEAPYDRAAVLKGMALH
ncbi:cysteine dioxygenase family protein [Plastoroseomonas arctica]|uniref:Metal-dependent protein of the double-stranded beta helix superfamily-like protein n=1 Tax=Plastoroseomonas arctica TaxID=1509237 RepID=A0AAF1KKF9_9PROT|nr:hypothetical protein [Plastoroseomonas arctica]MBR0653501.1 hypothetical protein [Plastoroseomonas arctica]